MRFMIVCEVSHWRFLLTLWNPLMLQGLFIDSFTRSRQSHLACSHGNTGNSNVWSPLVMHTLLIKLSECVPLASQLSACVCVRTHGRALHSLVYHGMQLFSVLHTKQVCLMYCRFALFSSSSLPLTAAFVMYAKGLYAITPLHCSLVGMDQHGLPTKSW